MKAARILVALLFGLVPALLASPATVQAAGLAISVSGNHLVNGAGRSIVLHGVDLSGTEFACSQNWSPDAYGDQPLGAASTYAAMRAWAVNVVRVPLNEDCWLGINGVRVGGALYQANIKAEVNLIHAAGMYAILDLHWSAPGAARALAQQPVPDADHSTAFWTGVAADYRGDPAVIFDLYNEPFLYGSYLATPSQDPWACWLNGCGLNKYLTGGSPYTQSVAWQSAGMQGLVNAVRGSGATQPILVNGLDWSNDLSGYLRHVPSDPRHQLIAGWHSYPRQSCGSACWNSVVAPIARQAPVLVGETGDSSNGSVTFLPTFLPWSDQHGISYVAWTWNPWQDASNVLIKDWRGTPTAGEGAYYRQHLLVLAGLARPAQAAPPKQAVASPSPSPAITPSPITSAAGSPSTVAEKPVAHTTGAPPTWVIGLVVVGVALALVAGVLALLSRRARRPGASRLP